MSVKKSVKVPAHLRRAVSFFYKNAGWGYDPKKETAKQGRMRGAIALAEAEHEGSQRGWHVTWEHDPEPYERGDAEPEDYEPEEVLGAVLRDENGKVLESLWSIADPDRNFARVVEAELMLEAI